MKDNIIFEAQIRNEETGEIIGKVSSKSLEGLGEELSKFEGLVEDYIQDQEFTEGEEKEVEQ